MSSLYFIALLPPPDIQAEVTAFKAYAAEHFQSRRALNSPPHITLIPPFRFEEAPARALRADLDAWQREQPPFTVQLDGFAAFPPRVIYVDIRPNEQLARYQQALADWLAAQYDISGSSPHGFHPHMTVAFKDLKRRQFPAAWSYFQALPYQRQFVVERLYLLGWVAGRWQVQDGTGSG